MHIRKLATLILVSSLGLVIYACDKPETTPPEPQPDPVPADTGDIADTGDADDAGAEGGDAAAEGGDDAGAEGGDAAADSPELIASGKEVFLSKCKSCHGEDGTGQTKIGKKLDIPNVTEAGWKDKNPKDKVVKTITDGREGTKMKAFKDKLSAEEIDAVAAFVISIGG